MLKYDSTEEFQVKRGYINRTKIYLYPAIVMMKSYQPFMVNLKDNFLCCSYNHEKIILYYDRKNTVAIHQFLVALKNNGEYINDYMHNEQVFAIEIKPDLNYSAFEEGRYTDIYTVSQINSTFSVNSKTKKILLKDPSYKQEFVDLLNEWFNTRYTIEAYEKRDDGSIVEISQFDIPPCLNQEIYGYEKKIRTGRGAGYTKSRRTIIEI